MKELLPGEKWKPVLGKEVGGIWPFHYISQEIVCYLLINLENNEEDKKLISRYYTGNLEHKLAWNLKMESSNFYLSLVFSHQIVAMQ